MAKKASNISALVTAIRTGQYDTANKHFAETMTQKLIARTQQEYATVAKTFITDGSES